MSLAVERLVVGRNSVRAPTADRTAVGVMRSQYDIAYGSFFLVGAGVLAVTVGGLLHIRVSEGALAFVGIWFGVVSIVALLTGFGYSLILWRHVPLPLLSLCSLLLVGTLMFEDAVSSALVNTVSVLYGVVTCALGLRWFFALRRHFHDADPGGAG